MTDRRLVVFSPGWNNVSLSLTPLRKRFIKEGFDAILVPHPEKGLRSIELSALHLSEIIDSVRTYYDHISLIGYAMGGLVGRCIVQHLNVLNINSFVAIGTPHFGYGFSDIAATSLSAKQMYFNSSFIKSLNREEWPLQIPALSVRGSLGQFILPALDEPFIGSDDVVIPYLTNSLLPLSYRTFGEIYSWLCGIFFPYDFLQPVSPKGVSSKVKQLL